VLSLTARDPAGAAICSSSEGISDLHGLFTGIKYPTDDFQTVTITVNRSECEINYSSQSTAVCRVSLKQTICIPPGNEMLVEGKLINPLHIIDNPTLEYAYFELRS
jgi:hypothetical protein